MTSLKCSFLLPSSELGDRGRVPPLFLRDPSAPPQEAAPEEDWGRVRVLSQRLGHEGYEALADLAAYLSVPRPWDQADYLLEAVLRSAPSDCLPKRSEPPPPKPYQIPMWEHPVFAEVPDWKGPVASGEALARRRAARYWSFMRWASAGDHEAIARLDHNWGVFLAWSDWDAAFQQWAEHHRKRIFGDPPSQELFRKHSGLAGLLVLSSSSQYHTLKLDVAESKFRRGWAEVGGPDLGPWGEDESWSLAWGFEARFILSSLREHLRLRYAPR